MLKDWLLFIGSLVFVIVILGIPVLLTLSIVFNWGPIMVVSGLFTIVEIILLSCYICIVITKGE